MSYYGQDPYGYGYGGYYPSYPYFPPGGNMISGGGSHSHHRRKPPKEKDNAQIWCDICDVGCIGQQSYSEHCSGRKHQLLERKRAAANISPSSSPQQQQASTSTANPATLDPLQPPTSSSLQQPSSSSSLSSSSNILSDEPYSPSSTSSSVNVRFAPYENTGPRTQGRFFCELCRIYSNDKSTFNLHLAGKKHKLNLQKVGQPQVTDPYGGPSGFPSSEQQRNAINLPRYHIPANNTSNRAHFTPALTSTPTNHADDNLLQAKLETLTPSSHDTLLLGGLIDIITDSLSEYETPHPYSTTQKPTPTTHPPPSSSSSKEKDKEKEREKEKEDKEKDKEKEREKEKEKDKEKEKEEKEGERPIIVETKIVGPYALGTLLKSNLSADIVVITQVPPTIETMKQIKQALAENHKELQIEVMDDSMDMYISSSPPLLRVHLLFSWLGAWETNSPERETGEEGEEGEKPEPTPPSMEAEPYQDMNIPACQRALMMVRQVMWFSDNSLSPHVRQCIKILKDLRHRNPAFTSLNNWALEVVVVNALRTLPLSASISQSLRAIFAFIASGMLLPGVELLDPCTHVNPASGAEPASFDGTESVLKDIEQGERLTVTEAAQRILNEIAFGRWDVIFE